MRLLSLRTDEFRNLEHVELIPSAHATVFVGENGQGKTNFLEAAGFLTALRSFRTAENKLLVGHGHLCAALAFQHRAAETGAQPM